MPVLGSMNYERLHRLFAMLKRLSLAVVLCGWLMGHAAPISAATVHVQLFPLTGEVRLVNRTASPLPIVFYSIKSNSGALNSSNSVWKSITSNYDAPFGSTPGNGFVDPDSEWSKLPSSSTELAEGVFIGSAGSLLPWRPVSLGRVWNPNVGPFDLQFNITSQSEMYDADPRLSIDGDYTGEGAVNQLDYFTWRQNFGSTSILVADGNINGIIDAADYVVWRKNLGLSIPATSVGAASGASFGLSIGASVVPEPSTVLLALMALGALCFGSKRRPR
jgi:hypothetical protein